MRRNAWFPRDLSKRTALGAFPFLVLTVGLAVLAGGVVAQRSGAQSGEPRLSTGVTSQGSLEPVSRTSLPVVGGRAAQAQTIPGAETLPPLSLETALSTSTFASERSREMLQLVATSGAQQTPETCDKVADPRGDDSHDGSAASPYRTATKLVQSLLAGQVGCLRAPHDVPGIYSENVTLNKSGTSIDDRTTLQTDPADALQGRFALLKGRVYISAHRVLVSRLMLDGRNAARLPGPTVTGDDVTVADSYVTNDPAVDCLLVGDQVSSADRFLLLRGRVQGCRTGVSFAHNDNGGTALSIIQDSRQAGVRFGPSSHAATGYRSILDGNVDNAVWSGSGTTSNIVQYSALSFPWHWNVAVDTADPVLVGSNNSAFFNCVWSTASSYASPHGISPEAQSRFYAGSAPNTIGNPAYFDRPGRNYTITPSSPCWDYTQSNRGTIVATHTDIYTEMVAGGGPTSADVQLTRIATNETGDSSEYDEVREASFLTYRPSQGVPAYDGSWVAQSHYAGTGQSASTGGGAFRVNLSRDWDGYYGTAVYFPPNTFTGNDPQQNGDVALLWWDNYDTYGPDADYGGIELAGFDHQAYLVRGQWQGAPEIIGEPVKLGEGCWNTIVVHQRFGGTTPKGKPPINEVFLNDKLVFQSNAPNNYGRGAQHIRYGFPNIQGSFSPLDAYFDDAYVSSYERLRARSTVCDPPETYITAGPSHEGDAGTFRFTSSASPATYDCRVDAGLWSSCTPPKHYSGLKDGEHAFEVRAVDSRNNMDGDSALATWQADGEANADSTDPAVSEDGRFIAFQSVASNLVPDDTNGVADVFVYDTQTDQFDRVSVSSSGDEGNGASLRPSISGDGRFVAYQSSAPNLVAGDTNRVIDSFLFDRLLRQTVRVSVTDTGGELAPCPIVATAACDTIQKRAGYRPSVSGDGRYVAFTSDHSDVIPSQPLAGSNHVYVYDRTAQRAVDVVTGGRQSGGGGGTLGLSSAMSDDGRYVVFESAASDLVSGDTNGMTDVFVRDRLNAVTSRASVNSLGVQGNGSSANATISPDGRYVAFDSAASNLVTRDFADTPDSDTNGLTDVFRRALPDGPTIRVSKNDASAPEPNGGSYLPALTGDGGQVAFYSDATNLPGYGADSNLAPDIFKWRGAKYTDPCCPGRVFGPIDSVSHNHFSLDMADGASSAPTITTDGQLIAYHSDASNQTQAGDSHTTDVFRAVLPASVNFSCVHYAADRWDGAGRQCHNAARMAPRSTPTWSGFLADYTRVFGECMAAFTTGPTPFPGAPDKYEEHKNNFPHPYTDVDTYKRDAQEIVDNPGTERCSATQGRTIFLVENPDGTGAIVIVQNGEIQTYFYRETNDARRYWEGLCGS
jgi:Tol biopolymer transport system component